MIHATTLYWMTEARYKRPYYMTLFIWRGQIGKSIETEHRLVVAWGWGKEKGEVTGKGHGVSFCGDENVLELDRGDGCTTLWIY